MQTERRLVPAADGPDIEFVVTGPEDGLPLVVHEGTPIGLAVNTRLAGAAAERGRTRAAFRAGRATRLRGVDAPSWQASP
jgi:hypothetical protein